MAELILAEVIVMKFMKRVDPLFLILTCVLQAIAKFAKYFNSDASLEFKKQHLNRCEGARNGQIGAKEVPLRTTCATFAPPSHFDTLASTSHFDIFTPISYYLIHLHFFPMH